MDLTGDEIGLLTEKIMTRIGENMKPVTSSGRSSYNEVFEKIYSVLKAEIEFE